MIVTVTVVKTDWQKPVYSLEIDGVDYDFRYEASLLLTDTVWGDGDGIFCPRYRKVHFRREESTVKVDFGSPWDPNEYYDPSQEIARRVALVNAAFAEVRESYERSYTVTL